MDDFLLVKVILLNPAVCFKTLKFCLVSVILGLVLALFSLTEAGLYFEEEWGLGLLFKMRGAVHGYGTKQITIISIDKISADILKLPEDPEKWPRTYYAELINKINRQNPALIAFNLYFSEKREPAQDDALAEAMRAQGNIVLTSYLKQFNSSYDNSLRNLRYERIINPIPPLANEALAIAPFPLPKTATTVKNFWAYRRNAGDIPTFPTAVFLSYLNNRAGAEIREMLRKVDSSNGNSGENNKLADEYGLNSEEGGVLEFFQDLHAQLKQSPQVLPEFEHVILESSWNQEKKLLLRSWLNLIKGQDNLYMNFYGKAGAITTIPFYQALTAEFINPAMFKDKIILIGYSEDIMAERNRGFYNVFSENSMETVSPIEIAATAVANLVDDCWLRPINLRNQFILIFTWGIVLSAICRGMPYRLAVATIGLLALGYITAAYYLFIGMYFWLPILFPIFVLTPFYLIMATVRHYSRRKQEHHKIYQTFSHYLPNDVVNSLVREADYQELGGYGKLVNGACMATDAGQYTTLSETMNPQALKELMNSYYGILFPQVKNSRGLISDVIGDAMLALWIQEKFENDARMNACHAALMIRKNVELFNRSQEKPLPTRIGLHYGQVHLGNVGAAGRYEYRAVGDIVNASTRIEGLNKVLGTQILVSANVIENLSGFVTRKLGAFIVKGKTLPIEIHELIAYVEQVEERELFLCSAFAESLALFENRQWNEALAGFSEIKKNFPDDGPTDFYITYLLSQPLNPETGDDRTAVINVGNITFALNI